MAGTTSGKPGEWRSSAGIAAATFVSFSVAVLWVAHRVSGQLVRLHRQSASVHIKLQADLKQEHQLKARLQHIIVHDRQLQARQAASLQMLKREHQQVVAEEKAINATITRIDHLSHVPVTNLLSISSGKNAGGVTSVSLPSMPQTPPVHATTGASGVP